MLSATDLRDCVIRPALTAIDLYSPGAEALLLGTALAESGLQALKQVNGPALGLFQMEPATHDDIHDNFLAFRAPLRERVLSLLAAQPGRHSQLASNLMYAAAMCRLQYRRARPPLPQPDDPDAMAAYWKAHYNTPQGAGAPSRFAALYRETVSPFYTVEV